MSDSRGSGEGVTQLLRAWNEGDLEALEQLMPMVHQELKRIARARFAAEGPGHTLQPTALVNEVYLRLARKMSPSWVDRGHFLAYAGAMMRSILVDHARRKSAAKRGGDRPTISIDDHRDVGQTADSVVDLVALDEALQRLDRLEPRQSRIVELRYFAGLTIAETAALLDLSISSVKDDWRMARSWLYRELTRARPDA
jgi:RNA polymerase sigma-70 factor (ECF subfamily)